MPSVHNLPIVLIARGHPLTKIIREADQLVEGADLEVGDVELPVGGQLLFHRRRVHPVPRLLASLVPRRRYDPVLGHVHGHGAGRAGTASKLAL